MPHPTDFVLVDIRSVPGGDCVQHRDGVDVRRSIVIAIVLSLHVVLAIWVTRPARPLQLTRRNHAPSWSRPNEVLTVRLLKTITVLPTMQLRAAPSGRLRPWPLLRRKPVRQQVGRPPEVTQPLRAASRSLDLQLARGAYNTGQWTIGRTLSASGRVAPQLPGGGVVHGAPVFHMTDPRDRGVVGVLRTVQGLFDIRSLHCLDIDAWRRLSPEQLAREDHLSEDEVNQMAAHYGCGPA